LNANTVAVPASTAGNFLLVGNPFTAPVSSIGLTGGTSLPYYVYTISQGGDQTAQRTKAGSWSAQLTSSTSATIPVLGAIIFTPTAGLTPYNITTAAINTGGTVQTGLFGGAASSSPLAYLELQVESNGSYEDQLFIRVDNTATAKSNDKIDLAKFTNDNVNVYTIAPDNKHLSIDARSSFDTTVALGLNASNASYTFKVANNSLPEGTTVYLADKLLNTRTELVAGAVYNFNVTSDSTTKGEKRFELQFSRTTTSSSPTIDTPASDGKFGATILGNVTGNNQVTVQVSGSQNPVTIKVIDINGKVVNTVRGTNGTNNVNIGQAGSGMVLLQISDGKNTIVKKVMKL
jgi:hypothetical protein